jgi:hypothetical protein
MPPPPLPPPPPPDTLLIAAAVFSESMTHDPAKSRPCANTDADQHAIAAIVSAVPACFM